MLDLGPPDGLTTLVRVGRLLCQACGPVRTDSCPLSGIWITRPQHLWRKAACVEKLLGCATLVGFLKHRGPRGRVETSVRSTERSEWRQLKLATQEKSRGAVRAPKGVSSVPPCRTLEHFELVPWAGGVQCGAGIPPSLLCGGPSHNQYSSRGCGTFPLHVCPCYHSHPGFFIPLVRVLFI